MYCQDLLKTVRVIFPFFAYYWNQEIETLSSHCIIVHCKLYKVKLIALIFSFFFTNKYLKNFEYIYIKPPWVNVLSSQRLSMEFSPGVWLDHLLACRKWTLFRSICFPINSDQVYCPCWKNRTPPHSMMHQLPCFIISEMCSGWCEVLHTAGQKVIFWSQLSRAIFSLYLLSPLMKCGKL